MVNVSIEVGVDFYFFFLLLLLFTSGLPMVLFVSFKNVLNKKE